MLGKVAHFARCVQIYKAPVYCLLVSIFMFLLYLHNIYYLDRYIINIFFASSIYDTFMCVAMRVTTTFPINTLKFISKQTVCRHNMYYIKYYSDNCIVAIFSCQPIAIGHCVLNVCLLYGHIIYVEILLYLRLRK